MQTHAHADFKSASCFTTSPILSPSDNGKNPLSDLLLDVNLAMKKTDNKKDLFEQIQSAFRIRQPGILSSTMSIWHKKYEIESEERMKLESKVAKLTQANKTLSSRIAGLQQKISNAGISPSSGNTTTQEKIELSNLDDESSQSASMLAQAATLGGLDLPGTANNLPTQISELQTFQNNEMIVDDEDCKACPNCKVKLESLQSELEEKRSRIKSLSEGISKLNQKSQIMANQNNMITSENSRLEKLNQELQDTLRYMEQHMTKMVQEQNDARKNYLNIIEEKRQEIELLNMRTKELESKAKQQNLQHARDMNLQMKQQQQQANNSGTKKKVNNNNSGSEVSAESSSMLVKRLLEENKSVDEQGNILRKSVLSPTTPLANGKSPSTFSINMRPAHEQVPGSVCFNDDISKIMPPRNVGRMSAGDETLNNLQVLKNQLPSEKDYQPIEEETEELTQRQTKIRAKPLRRRSPEAREEERNRNTESNNNNEEEEEFGRAGTRTKSATTRRQSGRTTPGFGTANQSKRLASTIKEESERNSKTLINKQQKRKKENANTKETSNCKCTLI